MRKLLLGLLLAAPIFFSTGCTTPAYSGKENVHMVLRNWDYEAKQAVDDADHILLLRPAGRMSIWALR